MKTTKESIVAFVEIQPRTTKEVFYLLKDTQRNLSALSNTYLRFVNSSMGCYPSLCSLFTGLPVEDSFAVFESESERKEKSLFSKMIMNLTPCEFLLSMALEYSFSEEGLEISSLSKEEKRNAIAGLYLAALYKEAQ